MGRTLTGGDRPRANGPRFGLVANAVHLTALSSFALAWRYFEPLGDAPDFFVNRGLGGREIVFYAISIVVLPPALLIALEWLAGLASLRLRDGLHLVVVGAFLALIAWQAVNDVFDPPPSAGVVQAGAASLGVAGAFAYLRFAGFRWWLTALSPAPAVILLLFLAFSPTSAIVFDGDGPDPAPVSSTRAPVVMVVFDEFPVVSLMGPRGRVDAARYPNFARLAGMATWYRNTASTADFTRLAVPSILTGMRGKPEQAEVAAEHPHSLFTLLGGSYHLDVSEESTDLCAAACPQQVKAPLAVRMRRLYGASIGAIPALPSWLRGRIARRLEPSPTDSPQTTIYERSVRRLERGPQETRLRHFLQILGRDPPSTVYFLHVQLPHRPFAATPDGHRYVPALDTDFYERWPADDVFARQAYMRHLLQVGFSDRLLGELLRRMRATGLLDRALLVVTADHGASFRPGDEARNATATNAAEVSEVPLFVKAPGQRRGRVSDGNVETIDVLPTIAQELEVRTPWRVDGKAADQIGGRRRKLVVWRVDAGGEVVVSRDRLARERRAALRRKLRLFGWGSARPGLFGGGPGARLVGRRLSSFHVVHVRGFHAALSDPSRYSAVRTGARFLPLDVSGVVVGGSGSRHAVLVAVDGRIVATAWCDAGSRRFAAVVPSSSLREGVNDVEVLTPVRAAGGSALALLGTSSLGRPRG